MLCSRVLAPSSRIARAAASLGLAAVLAGAASGQVRISQVYGGGGDLGAPIASDFVELYNAGVAPVSLAGWSVQYATAIGPTWQVTALPAVSLDPGRYFLVQESSGATLGGGQSVALPAPDATGSINVLARGGKVALCDTTVALSGATPTNASIRDFVGYGTGASWREPFSGGAAANNAPTPNVSAAIYRIDCGAQDTNSNNSDFALAYPTPRNTGVPANLGATAIGMVQPFTAEPLQTVRVTATPFVCSTLALDVGTSVTADLSSIGGSANTSLYDDGTGGDELAGDGVFSVSATVAAGTSSGSKHFAVRVLDGGLGGACVVGMNVLDASAPDNDDAARATAVAIPSQTLGDFTGAHVEYNPVFAFAASPGLQSAMGARRGVWYSLVGNGNSLTAQTCDAQNSIDTVLAVFSGSSDGLTLVAFNDDGPTQCGAGSFESSATWCSLAGATYYVWVGPWNAGAQTNSFTLTILDGGSCVDALPVASCVLAGSPTEVEPALGPASNDGCDSTPERFTTIASPAAAPSQVRGSTRAYGFMRDIDWYRFQATNTGYLTATLTANFSGVVELRQLSATGTCSTNILLAQSPMSRPCTASSLSGSLITVGEWYALRVVPMQQLAAPSSPNAFGGVSIGAHSDFYVLDTTVGTPPNDLCANATPLALGAAPLAGSTLGATNDGSSTCDPVGNDVWYSVATTTQGSLHVDTCASPLDTAISVYASCGGAQLGCNDEANGTPCSGPSSALTLPGLPAGTYLIRISDRSAAGIFLVRASFSIDNDLCANAIALAVPSVTAGTTTGATVDSGLALAGGPGIADAGGNALITAPGVWYSVTTNTAETVYADTLLAGYDTKLSVYTGVCGTLSPVTMNDDAASSYRSKVAWVAQPGTTYLILVHGFAQASGDFQLVLTSAPTPSNDECASPIALSGTSGSLATTNAGATGAASQGMSNSIASCAAAFTYWDTWYSWTAPCSSTVQFATCGSFDTVLSIHSSCPTSTGTQIGALCSDNAVPGCAPGSSISFSAVANTTYWIRVATAGAATANQGGGSSYTLTWAMADADLDGTADCFDGCPSDPGKITPGICGCGVSDADSDGDGTVNCLDGCPNDPNKLAPGVCGCGVADVDSDGDGTLNCLDGCPNDPAKIAAGACGCGVPDIDSDGDGSADCVDGCPTDPAKVAPGMCGCGIADTDSDGDGVANCIDGCPNDPNKASPGACGCGVADADSDGDGTVDCNDGCPLDPNKVAPGICGCGTSDADTDGDGIVDCQDNCDAIANPSQADCDSDGIGDVCAIAAGAPDSNSNGIPDGCDIANVTSYCTSGTSTHNCVATMGATGTPSASATSGFTLRATNVEGLKSGLIFYGISGSHSTPWYGQSTSFLCVKSPTQRTPAANSGGTLDQCDGSLSVDFLAYRTSHPNALGAPFAAGQIVWAQAWYRDPPAPKTTNLSNGLQFTFAP